MDRFSHVWPSGTFAEPFDPSLYDACLFDLDGVLTPTADIHRKAWAELFTMAFDRCGSGDVGRSGSGDIRPFDDTDYFTLVDGRPRYEAVRAVLASRGLTLPDGSPSDPGSLETVCAMGNLKDSLFLEAVSRGGVNAYPGSLRFMRAAAAAGWKLGVVSASQNARTVLKAAGILDEFDTIVDGHVAIELGLPGKPSPDTYLEGARRLGAEPARTIVIEDALGGVEAGHAGGFALVIGVNRGAGADALLAHGASIVVDDLGQLVSDDTAPVSSCQRQDLHTDQPVPDDSPSSVTPPLSSCQGQDLHTSQSDGDSQPVPRTGVPARTVPIGPGTTPDGPGTNGDGSCWYPTGTNGNGCSTNQNIPVEATRSRAPSDVSPTMSSCRGQDLPHQPSLKEES